MSCRRLRPILLLAAVFSVSCASSKPQGVERIAILPFENLSARADVAWMSRGFAEALRLSLAGSSSHQAFYVGALRDVPATGAASVVQGYFSTEGAVLRVHAVMENVESRRMALTADVTGAEAEGMLPLAEAVARKLDYDSRPAATLKAEAFRVYVEGLEASTPASADAAFERATQVDPAFGAAWLAWAQSLVSRNERSRAIQVILGSRARKGEFPDLERLRLDVLAGGVAGDRQAEQHALIELAQADRADAGVRRGLGDLAVAAREWRQAAAWYEQALEREPDNANGWNQLGYARMWAGDTAGAAGALSRYRQLRPADANPVDSLGDVHYYAGKFSDAERLYLEAAAKDPSFLGGGDYYKAAWARLMRGDVKGGDELFGRFLNARRSAGDPLAEFRQAEWEYLSGRRRSGIARLERLARSGPPPVAALSLGELSLWLLETGDRARARQYAGMLKTTDGIAALARFLTQPPATAEEWKKRAATVFPGPAAAPLQRIALPYALLFSGEYQAAVEPLDQLCRASDPSSADRPAVALAWALAETGDFRRIPELVNPNPAPDPLGQHLFSTVAFPRVLFLRGLVAEREGRQADAKQQYGLYVQFLGDLAPPSHDTDRARAALGKP